MWSCTSRPVMCKCEKCFNCNFCNIPLYGNVWKSISWECQNLLAIFKRCFQVKVFVIAIFRRCAQFSMLCLTCKQQHFCCVLMFISAFPLCDTFTSTSSRLALPVSASLRHSVLFFPPLLTFVMPRRLLSLTQVWSIKSTLQRPHCEKFSTAPSHMFRLGCKFILYEAIFLRLLGEKQLCFFVPFCSLFCRPK